MTTNWQSDVQYARDTWAQFLSDSGVTCTIKRVQEDEEGLSISEGSDIVYVGVPFGAAPGGSNSSPTTMSSSAQKHNDAYVSYPMRLTFPFGTDIQSGDRIEQEPINTGLPVYEAKNQDNADPNAFDLQVDVEVLTIPK